MRPPKPRTPRADKPRRPPSAPTEPSLHEAALAHLARFATTQAGLTRVLQRRVDRWARQTEGEPESIAAVLAAARSTIAAVVARLVAAGAVSDAVFAAARARSLSRAGRSRRAIGAHLASRGVGSSLAAETVPHDPEQELAAALIHARRRRMGPWRVAEPAPETARRELASFARAGYAHGVARKALTMDVAEAEAMIARFRAAL